MEMHDFDLIIRVSHVINKTRRAVAAASGLASVHLDILTYVAQEDRATPQSVASHLGLTKGTVSQSISLLARRGYVGKISDEHDGRLSILQLKESAFAVLGDLKEAMAVLESGIEINSAYRRVLRAVLFDMEQQLGHAAHKIVIRKTRMDELQTDNQPEDREHAETDPLFVHR